MLTKTIACITLAIAPLLSMASPELVGSWNGVSTDPLALPGQMTFQADGRARLAPSGYTPLDGTWLAEGSRLQLSMPPHGSTQMDFELNGDSLTLKHDNGAQEQFVRAQPLAEPALSVVDKALPRNDDAPSPATSPAEPEASMKSSPTQDSSDSKSPDARTPASILP